MTFYLVKMIHLEHLVIFIWSSGHPIWSLIWSLHLITLFGHLNWSFQLVTQLVILQTPIWSLPKPHGPRRPSNHAPQGPQPIRPCSRHPMPPEPLSWELPVYIHMYIFIYMTQDVAYAPYTYIFVHVCIYNIYTQQYTYEDNETRKWILEALHVVLVVPGREPLVHLVKFIRQQNTVKPTTGSLCGATMGRRHA